MVVDSAGTAASHRTPPRPNVTGARIIAIVSVVLTLTIALHSFLPGSLGTLLATALPWLGWLIPVLLVASLCTRRRRVWVVVSLPALVWALLVGSTALPLGSQANDGATDAQLSLASHNVRGASDSAAQSAKDLAAEGADVIALVELTAHDREAAANELATSHPYSYTVGTVGVWSAYPIGAETPLDLGLGWKRALSVDVTAPSGPVSVYVIHAASFRPGDQQDRDTMLQNLGALIPQDLNERVVVMGDFNATTFDPAMGAILDTVQASRQSTPSWGFTWPSQFPIARIDHILERGFTPLESRVFAAGNSDHLAILSVLRND